MHRLTLNHHLMRTKNKSLSRVSGFEATRFCWRHVTFLDGVTYSPRFCRLHRNTVTALALENPASLLTGDRKPLYPWRMLIGSPA